MNLCLIGYRGTGKTSVAKRLGLILSRVWIDSDVEVELAAGKSIAAIFQEDGESAFRTMETSVLVRLLAENNQVLALGGGVILKKRNRELLRQSSQVVWLRASPTTLHHRLATDPTTVTQRPNLTAEGGLQEIESVLASRESYYRECADLEVDTQDKDVAAVAKEIVHFLNLLPTES